MNILAYAPLALLLALAPCTPTALGQELTSVFQDTADGKLPVDPNALGAVTLGDNTAYVSRPGNGSTRLDVFDAGGTRVWTRTLAPGGPSLQALRYLSMTAADDAALVVTVMGIGGAGLSRFRLQAFDAATGVPAWDRLLDFGPAPDGVLADLQAGEGRVALLQDRFATSSAPGLVRISIFDAVTGGTISTTPDVLLDRAAFTFDPAGTRSFLFGRDGALQSHDATSGALLWSNVTPVSPVSFAGTNALALSGDGLTLARSDGGAVMGLEAATGALVWTNANLDEPREVIAYGDDAFFAAGVIDGGGIGGFSRVSMLDATTGVTLWTRSDPLYGGSSSVPFFANVHAAEDFARGLVAFVRSGLFVFDAASGALLSSSDLEGSADQNNSLLRPQNGGWVAFLASPLFSPILPLQAFDPAGAPLWSKGPVATEIVGTRSRWAGISADGARSHSLWTYTEFESVPLSSGRYEVRDTSTGELVHDWPVTELLNRDFVLSPDGSRLAFGADGGFGSDYLKVLDTTDGSLIGPPEFTQISNDATDHLVWNAASNRLANISSSGDVTVSLLNGQAAVLWTRDLEVFGSGVSGSKGKLAIRPDNGQVYAAYEARQNSSERALRIHRLSANNGTLLGSVTWNPPAQAGGNPLFETDTPLELFLSPEVDRGYVLVESDQSDEQLHLVEFSLSDMTVTAERQIDAGAESVDYFAQGSALTSDGKTLLLASRPNNGFTQPRPVVVNGLDLPGLAVRWETLLDPDLAVVARVGLVNDRIGVLASVDGFVPGTISLIDLADGSIHATAPTPELFGLNAQDYPELAAANGRLFLIGEAQTDPPAGISETYRVGELLANASSLTSGPLGLVLDAGEDKAGHSYWMLGTRSGTSPGLAIGSVTVPLNPDGYTSFLIDNTGQPPLTDTFGTLDAQGTARGELLYPALDPALFGLTLHHAAITWDPAGFDVDFTTYALPLVIG